MKLLVDKSFVRDSKKLPHQAQKQLKEIITKLLSSASWQEINAAKMEGAKNAYRIRFGNYRLGIYKDGEYIVLSRVLDRKDIYRYFPKK